MTKRAGTDIDPAGSEAVGSAEALSPAEAYAQFRARAEREQTPLGRFLARTDFDLDDFQIQACTELQEGRMSSSPPRRARARPSSPNSPSTSRWTRAPGSSTPPRSRH